MIKTIALTLALSTSAAFADCMNNSCVATADGTRFTAPACETSACADVVASLTVGVERAAALVGAPPRADLPSTVPDELQALGVSPDRKTFEAPDGTVFQCDGGFYGIVVNGAGTIFCNE